MNIRFTLSINNSLRCISMYQHKQHSNLLQRTIRHISQKILPNLTKLSLLNNILRFNFFLFLLKIIFRLRLWHFQCIFLIIGCIDRYLLFFRTSSLISYILHLYKGHIISYHLLTHLL